MDRRTPLALTAALLVLSGLTGFGESRLHAQQLAQTWLVDFGPDDGVDGEATPSPDRRGATWNNLADPGALGVATALTNARGESTPATITLGGSLSARGLQHGGMTDPDTATLGALGIATATQDFFETISGATLTLGGLDPARGYTMRLFGSRSNLQERRTRIIAQGANLRTGELQTSGPDLGGPGVNANPGSVAAIAPVFPTPSGEITITLEKTAGNYAYVNALLIGERTDASFEAVASIAVIGDDVTGNGATARLRAELTPTFATIRGVDWCVDDVSVATIRPDGQLVPRKNGTVTAFAKTQEFGSDVVGAKQLEITGQRTTTYFLDFGPDDVTNGNATASPDARGNHWTNLTDPAAGTAALVTSDGAATTLRVEASGLRSNGLRHGGLTAPIDTLLGELATPTATQDYFFTDGSGQLVFRGLNPANGYRFFAHASRDNPERRITGYALDGASATSGTLQSSGAGLGAGGTDGNDAAVYTSELVRPSAAGTIALTVTRETGSFAYLNALQLVEFDSVGLCPDRDAQEIVFMGSSVARGQGAPNDRGYAYLTNETLQRRATQGDGLAYRYANVSVGGNRTTDVLARYDRDLLAECGGYVVYGLSLANEGIRSGGQATYDQFRDNLALLVDKALADGYQPVVVSNYARGDYDAGDYAFIRRINIEIAQWDAPSVNVLGALDDGTGRWPQGFAADNGHPNAAGHAEFAASFVPSLFDALEAGKPAPERVASAGLAGGEFGGSFLGAPDVSGLRSFTSAFEFAASEPGVLAVVSGYSGSHRNDLMLTDAGDLLYTHPDGQTITGGSGLLDGATHDVALTYYHAGERVGLYVDGVAVGFLDARFGSGAPEPQFAFPSAGTARIAQWHLYRAGMNADELALVAADSMLTSSLEVYAPLDGDSGDRRFENRARSTVEVMSFEVTAATRPAAATATLRAYPNPTTGIVTLRTGREQPISGLEVFNALGQRVPIAVPSLSADSVRLDLTGATPGTYTLRVRWVDGARENCEVVVR